MASYLQYQSDRNDDPDVDSDDHPPEPPSTWLGGNGGLQASPALAAATTDAEALAAAEKMFFGNVIEMPKS